MTRVRHAHNLCATCEDGVIVPEVAANELSGRINDSIPLLPLMVAYPDPLAALFLRRSCMDTSQYRVYSGQPRCLA